LEIKSSILAFTLKKCLKGSYELIAAIPLTRNGDFLPSANTMEFLNKNGVKIKYFSNPHLNCRKEKIPGDFIGNKIYALKIPVKGSKVMFLDSDIICIKDFHIQISSFPDEFYGKQANRANVNKWEEIYSLFNLSMPDILVPCTVDNKIIPPYFNSGVLIFDSKIIKEFLKVWEKYFIELSSRIYIKSKLYKPYHRDQVALSLAINKLNIHITFLGEEYNFPVRSKKIKDYKNIIFAHYHDPFSAYNTKIIREEILSIALIYPEFIEIIKLSKLFYSLFFGTVICRGGLIFRKSLRRIYLKYKNIFKRELYRLRNTLIKHR
jgi:lipopolysaccharide biosynthesis glycosyltransferase